MRASVISAVLFAAVLIFVFSSTGWLSGFFKSLLDLCEDLPDTPASDGGKTELLSQKWKSGKTAVLLFYDKSRIDALDKAVSELQSACEREDEKEYAAARAAVIYEIRQVTDMIRISPENIL